MIWWMEIVSHTAPMNRQEEPLRQVAVVEKILDDNKLKIHLKSKFALFQTSSVLLNFI